MAAAWLLTYALHSTLLLGGALLLRLALGERRLALQEAALRAALLGGFLTASLQLGLGLRPLAGVVPLPARGEAVPAARGPRAAPRPAVPVRSDFGAVATVAPPTSDPPPARAPRGGPASWSGPFTDPLGGLALAWLGLGAIAVARLGVATARLRHLLKDRRPIGDGLVAACLPGLASRLAVRQPVTLSLAPRLKVPLAIGVRRPEICLPERALVDLGGEERLALVAHELAHVARRDPAWVLLARLACALGSLQPLNLWARRRLQDLAECLSDDLAAAASERPESLARSLVEVASWTLAGPAFLPATAAGALSPRSRLGHRVERLMDPLRLIERPRRALLPLTLTLVAAGALVVPVVSGSLPPVAAAAPGEPAASPTPPAPPLPPPAAEAPEAPGVPEAPPLPPAPRAPRPPRAPRAPAAAPAPPAPPEPESDTEAERALEELSARIGARAAAQGAELEGLERQIEQLVAGGRPSESELRELREKARALAEAARPTERELAELRRLSREMARSARANAEQARRSAREASARTREEMRRAIEEARRVVEEARRAIEEMRRELAELHHGEEARRTPPPEPEP